MNSEVAKNKQSSPKNFTQKLLAKNYFILLIAMLSLSIKGLIHFKNKINFLAFSIYISIGCIFGWTWNIFTNLYDPSFPGWYYSSFVTVYRAKFMVLEDWLFYPICGALFYVVRLLTPQIPCSSISRKLLVGFLILIGCISLFIFKSGGCSVTLWFLFPGFIMMWFTTGKWSTYRFIIVSSFIVIFAVVWDILATYMFSKIFNLPWLYSWSYVIFDSNGIPKHSDLWLSYTSHKWDWIFRSPLEITPWFSICGSVFIYFLAEFCESIFSSKPNKHS